MPQTARSSRSSKYRRPLILDQPGPGAARVFDQFQVQPVGSTVRVAGRDIAPPRTPAQLPTRGAAAVASSPTPPPARPSVGYDESSPIHSILNILRPSARQSFDWYDPDAPNYVPLSGELQGPGQFEGPSDTQQLGQRRRFLDKLLAEIEGQDALDAAHANMAGVDQELAALNGVQTPQRRFQPFTSSVPRPTRTMVPYPDRPEPRVDPGLALLSGLFSVIRPEGTGHFASGTLEGAVDRADREYKDRLNRFGYALDQANTRFGDDLATYDERNRIELGNLRGGEASDYQNSAAAYGRDIMRVPLSARRASLNYQLGTPTQPGSLSRRASALNAVTSAASDVADVQSRIDRGLASNAAQAAAAQKDQEGRIETLKAVSPIITADLNRKQEAKRHGEELALKARELGLEEEYKRGQLAVSNGHLQLAGAQLGIARTNALANLASKGLMIDRAGNIVRDPTKPPMDNASRTALANAREALRQAQGRSAAAFGELEKQIRAQNPDLSTADIATRVFNSPSYIFLRSMEEAASSEVDRLSGAEPGISVRLQKVAQEAARQTSAGGNAPSVKMQKRMDRDVAQSGKALDEASARAILREAGGDPARAREIARKRGFAIPR